MDNHIIITADRKAVKQGDRVYDYYSLKWGTIANDIDSEGWFTCNHEDGTSAVLNGERICTYVPERFKS